MLKITLSNHAVREIAHKDKELYVLLAAHHNAHNEETFFSSSKWPTEFPDAESIDKHYFGDWNAFVNAPEDVHPGLINKVVWKPVLPLKIMGERGVMKEAVVNAVNMNQVRLPDNLMLQIREVCAVEDICTNELQNQYLAEGWKILAVLPQVGQRRPDYVLARF